MYCKNCGNELNSGAAICVNCGFAKGNGNKFCHNCGAEALSGASVCTKCGAILESGAASSVQKSKLVALLLAFFLGAFGVHDFYLGFTSYGILKIVITLVSCGTLSWIWPLIDLIRILTNSLSVDAAGNPLKKEF